MQVQRLFLDGQPHKRHSWTDQYDCRRKTRYRTFHLMGVDGKLGKIKNVTIATAATLFGLSVYAFSPITAFAKDHGHANACTSVNTNGSKHLHVGRPVGTHMGKHISARIDQPMNIPVNQHMNMNVHTNVHVNDHLNIHNNVHVNDHPNEHINVHVNDHLNKHTNVHANSNFNLDETVLLTELQSLHCTGSASLAAWFGTTNLSTVQVSQLSVNVQEMVRLCRRDTFNSSMSITEREEAWQLIDESLTACGLQVTVVDSGGQPVNVLHAQQHGGWTMQIQDHGGASLCTATLTPPSVPSTPTVQPQGQVQVSTRVSAKHEHEHVKIAVVHPTSHKEKAPETKTHPQVTVHHVSPEQNTSHHTSTTPPTQTTKKAEGSSGENVSQSKLPQTGTEDPLMILIGLILTALGSAGLGLGIWVTRR